MMTVGFNSVTVGFSKRSYTAELMLGFSKVCEDESLLLRSQGIIDDTEPSHRDGLLFTVVDISPQIFLFVC